MEIKTYTTVKINLSTDLKRLAEKEAGKIGFSLQDFMRMTLGAHLADVRRLTMEERLYQNALLDIKAGRYKSFKNAKEMVKHLDSLVK